MKTVLPITFILLLVTINLNAQFNLDQFYESGRNHLAKNNFIGAIDAFNVVIKYKSDFSDVFYLRAIARFNLNDFQGALSDFSKAITINPFNPYYYLYRGMTKEKLSDFNGAKKDYDNSIEIEAINPDNYIRRGIVFIILKNYDNAISDFDMAIRIDRNLADAYRFRALAKQYTKLNILANEDYAIAIKLNPYNSDTYIKRGRNWSDMNEYNKAIDDYNKAIQFDSINSFAYFNRALAYCELNNYNAALNDFNKVVAMDPKNSLTYYNRAELKAKIDDLQGALEDYNKVLEFNPRNIYTYFNRGIIWHKLGKFKEAISDYTIAIDIYPYFAVAYYNRSIARKSIGDYLGAVSDYKSSVKINEEIDKNKNNQIADTTNLTKIIEFDADFDEGNSYGDDLARNSDIYPLSNFSVNIADIDSLSKLKDHNENIVEKLNAGSSQPFRFIFSNTACKVTEQKAGEILKILDKKHDEMSELERFANATLNCYLKNFNDAIDNYTKIIKKNPEFALAYFNRANTRFEMISFLNSLGDYNTVISFNNDISKTTSNILNSEIRTNYDEVYADYEKILKIEPDFFYVYFNLGNVNAEARDFIGAINNYSKALAIKPDFNEALYNRGLVYIYLKQKDKGCSDLSKAAELGMNKSYLTIKKLCN